MVDIVIKEGRIVTPTDIYEADIGIKDGKIVEIARNIEAKAEQVIDASGKYVLPGAIDPHTHMEMPFMGTTSADDFETGTIAAAFGGVTTIIDFAIQPKGKSFMDTIEIWRSKADPKVVIDYSLHAAVTDLNEERMAELPKVLDYGVTSFKLFMPYRKESLMSDDGRLYAMLDASREHRFLVQVHAENAPVLEYLVEKFLKEGKKTPEYHALSRPNFVEGEAIQRAIYLAHATNGNLYIVHMSTKEGLVAVAESLNKGFPVYAETCPHYLVLTEEKYYGPDGRHYVMSPPLRSRADIEVLWKGLASEKIVTVGSDHCPFNSEQKAMGKDDFTKIPNGVPGTEVIIPILYSEGVRRDIITINQLVKFTSYNVAKLFGLYPRKGTIAVGADADITILDPDYEMELSVENLHTKIDYSIYDGMKVKGVPITTICRGKPIVLNREFVGKKGEGQFIPRSRFTGL